MAAINYSGITDQLATLLRADSRTSAARIFVEEEPQVGLMDQQSAIAIFMDGRTAAPQQLLKAGKATIIHIRMSLWVVSFSIESFVAARAIRDPLLGNLELVLMANRTIGGLVEMSWLEGGSLVSARDDSGSSVFVAAAETVLVAEAIASN